MKNLFQKEISNLRYEQRVPSIGQRERKAISDGRRGSQTYEKPDGKMCQILSRKIKKPRKAGRPEARSEKAAKEKTMGDFVS